MPLNEEGGGGGKPEIANHYYAHLLRAELVVITASRQFLWPRDGEKKTHESSRKVYAALVHLNGISNTI
jgi:hypothetical protein